MKNNGLDLIEVQDNGGGISPSNYENIGRYRPSLARALKLITPALKHYTSKLASYDDLARLQTFGFRGEALSSLCALSDFHVTTAQADQAPKANRLDFEVSGKLNKTKIVAGQKGTTASVEGLFKRLPVRRRELEKNIKREYGKVLNMLHAYACVGTGVRFSVRNTVGKTKNVVVFTTKGNQTTRENIANVYGAKTLVALIPLDLTLEFESSFGPSIVRRREGASEILVKGHISRPVFGEGRQTPDRQMFFVNSRPCGLPQIAKAFNEVYKSFNVSQSPFIFADFHMDTDAYDVNVSPDKRTIMLHDAGALIESLKTSLAELFESSDQTVPQSQVARQAGKGQPERTLQSTLPSLPSQRHEDMEGGEEEDSTGEADSSQVDSQSRIRSVLGGLDHRASTSSPARGAIDERNSSASPAISIGRPSALAEDTQVDEPRTETPGSPNIGGSERVTQQETQPEHESVTPRSTTRSEQHISEQLDPLTETPNPVQSAYDRMRPKRVPAELATITIGDKTVTSMVGSGIPKKRYSDSTDSASRPPERKRRSHTPSRPGIFGKYMKGFVAPGSHDNAPGSEDEQNEEAEEDGDSESGRSDEAQSVRSEDPHVESSARDTDTRDEPAEVDNETEGNDERPASPVEDGIGEEEKRAKEEAEVQRLIQNAENKAVVPVENNIHRANKLNKSSHRDSTVQLVSTVDGSLPRVQTQMGRLQSILQNRPQSSSTNEPEPTSQESAEERLALTVSKDDFSKMRIIGQFNLGFIIATRPSADSPKDELFIIDQHASDEKFNFERLQAETVVQNQRLVQPKTLDLTAVEEEIVLENQSTLEKNGFIVDIDDSGAEPIGRRCKLVSLPLSKEVVFGVRDLEELIVALSELPATSTQKPASDAYIPRPDKVRKMFAMRACRSSIMIGKTLTTKQMERVVRNMGTIDKPWNCPHGRPTMRHLMSLGGWNEWDELGDVDGLDVWRAYMDAEGSELDSEAG